MVSRKIHPPIHELVQPTHRNVSHFCSGLTVEGTANILENQCIPYPPMRMSGQPPTLHVQTSSIYFIFLGVVDLSLPKWVKYPSPRNRSQYMSPKSEHVGWWFRFGPPRPLLTNYTVFSMGSSLTAVRQGVRLPPTDIFSRSEY